MVVAMVTASDRSSLSCDLDSATNFHMALQLCLLLGEHLFRGDCVGRVDRHILWQELVNAVDGMVCAVWNSNPAQTDNTETKA